MSDFGSQPPLGPPPSPAVRPRERVRGAATPPPQRPSPSRTAAGPARRAGTRTQLLVLVVALAVGLGGGFVLSSGTAQAGEVVLEAAPAVGPDPFTPPVDPLQPTDEPTDQPTDEPTDEPTGEPTVEPTDPATPRPSLPQVTVTVGGRPIGLYGGSGDDTVCDRDRLVDFLLSNAQKAAAWARAQGIDPSDLRGYLESLVPAVLRADARVTNHGFRNGQATPRQSLLQAGTAVLVDRAGVPRARCKCGNPLRPAVLTASKPKYVGTRWKGFSENAVVAVAPERAVATPTATSTATRPPATRPPTLRPAGTWRVTGANYVSRGDCVGDVAANGEVFTVTQGSGTVTLTFSDGGEAVTLPINPEGFVRGTLEGVGISGQFRGNRVDLNFDFGDNCIIHVGAQRIG